MELLREVGRSPWEGFWAPSGPNSLPCPSSPSLNKRYKNDPPNGGPFFYGKGCVLIEKSLGGHRLFRGVNDIARCFHFSILNLVGNKNGSIL